VNLLLAYYPQVAGDKHRRNKARSTGIHDGFEGKKGWVQKRRLHSGRTFNCPVYQQSRKGGKLEITSGDFISEKEKNLTE